jgi:DNA-binding CsgD family transcriptional regulator
MLDAVDYGLALVDGAGRTRFINAIACRDCTGAHPLTWDGSVLKAQRPEDARALAEALEAACRKGLQRMIILGRCGERSAAVSVVPIEAEDLCVRTDDSRWDAGQPGLTRWAMLILGKSRLCDALSIDAFGRAFRLTNAEGRVLRLLCGGEVPRDIARRLGVAVSTVRTQITMMRGKAGARSMVALVRMVSVLPPLLRLTPEAA